jgi:hypothetical protein
MRPPEPPGETETVVSRGRIAVWLRDALTPALRWLTVAAWRLAARALGAALRGLVYILASPVILMADLIQPDPGLSRSWISGFMGFMTVLIGITWGFGYLVTVETLEGNALMTTFAEIGPQLAGVPYVDHIQVSAAEHGLDPALVAAIITQESGFDPNAVSPAGARGLMQIMPSTWRFTCPGSPCGGAHQPPACGPDCIFDPAANIRAGTRYFARVLDHFDGNTVLAFAAYNAGSASVRRYLGPDENAGSLERLPPFAETRTYVYRVLSFWAELRAGGVPDVAVLSAEECRLLRQLATVFPALVLGLWGLFAAWVARRLSQR